MERSRYLAATLRRSPVANPLSNEDFGPLLHGIGAGGLRRGGLLSLVLLNPGLGDVDEEAGNGLSKIPC